MTAQNKTYPFVIGMLVTLFTHVIYLSGPSNPWEVMIVAAKIMIPATVVALFEWWSRAPPILEDDKTDL